MVIFIMETLKHREEEAATLEKLHHIYIIRKIFIGIVSWWDYLGDAVVN